MTLATGTNPTVRVERKSQPPEKLPNMASSGTATHQVFIGFSCKELGQSFVSHLNAALRRNKISAFADNDISESQRGQISRETRAAIEGSRVSVVVFSGNYAQSPLCLEKLVKILECRRKKGQAVVPVFYGVGPSDVKHQTGSFAEAFAKHARSEFADRVSVWREALGEAAGLPGHESNDGGSESKLVEEIVCDVNDRLFPTDKIGISSRLLEIENLLCKQPWGIRSIGIWGIGGIGKTTIAQAAFDKMSGDYEASYFVQDFDKTSREEGLYHLRDCYLAKILKEEFNAESSIAKPSLIRDKFRLKRILVVLDDVRNSMDAESFLGGFDWFGPGSVIIVTSRDKQVLVQCHMSNIYLVQCLNQKEARRLFSQCAFGKDEPENDFSELSEMVIQYAKGNPLALHLFSRELKGKKLAEIETSFPEFKQRHADQILDVFKSSYDALSNIEKNIFLDIACFFRGENRDHVMQLLDGCGFFPRIGIEVLVDKSLLTISENRVEMHNLIQDVGRAIINRETGQPVTRSRLWDSLSIKDVLTRDPLSTEYEETRDRLGTERVPRKEKPIGTEDIEGIFLDTSGLSFAVEPTAFDNMYNLRLLKIYSSSPGKHSGLGLPKRLLSLPCELRLLHWENYPLESLPQDFDPEKLVELNMPYSQLKKLWERNESLEMLKTVKLSHSRQLVEIPGLSRAHNLEHIDLQGCTSLQGFPDAGRLEHLQFLNLSGCKGIKTFPEVPHNIKVLYLEGTDISKIPDSIQTLSKLVKLDLGNCTRLENLPKRIYKLTSLELLNLSGCLRLESFPEILEDMKGLRYLYLNETAIKELPSSISNLTALEELGLKNCTNLPKRPDIVSKLKTLKKFEFDGNVESSS